MSDQHRVFCPAPVNRTLQERLLPFLGRELPFLSAGNPPFGGSNQLVQEVGPTYIRVQDVDDTSRVFRFFERPLVFFITAQTDEQPPAAGRVRVTIDDPELNEIFEFPVELFEIGLDYIEVFVTFRRALIPISPFMEFTCVEDGPEE